MDELEEVKLELNSLQLKYAVAIPHNIAVKLLSWLESNHSYYIKPTKQIKKETK